MSTQASCRICKVGFRRMLTKGRSRWSRLKN
ncbi:hypothetical protein DSM3645_03048 [Blastopirellula marina DSM 3645]|uniref:Uncharacterized protein n=1 Tax=Blastopirellula marina DSM 3645 TaxID=314230 RepID=A3ZVS3_9BACT|nr:hypothetical protein DSM3645_03048 [Blastopirellula marina DSM 3645]